MATTVAGLQALPTGPADVYKGPSWHFRIIIGTGFALAPISMESLLSVDGGGSITSSNIGVAAGIPAFAAGLRYDPYYSTGFAVSLFSNFLIGFNVLDASTSGRVMTGSLGMEVFLKFFGKYSGVTLQSAYLWRNAYASSGFDVGVASSSGTGEGTLGALRFGGALSGCLTESHPGGSLPPTCGVRLLLGAYAELPMSDGYEQGVGIVGHLGLSGDNALYNIGLDLAPGYPAVGSSYGTGFLVAFTFAKSIDWFGGDGSSSIEESTEVAGAPGRESSSEMAIAARSRRRADDFGLPRCTPDDVSGRWYNGSVFTMTLAQEGSVVVGDYQLRSGTQGHIRGVLSAGNTLLRGEWRESSGQSGRFEWYFQESASRFSGAFSQGDAPLTDRWSGRRACTLAEGDS